jgi:flagellar export protein FliJ
MALQKFTFSLDPLLKARRLSEQKLQRVVAQNERERMELEETLRRQQLNIAQSKLSRQDSLVGKLDAAGLRMHAAASIALMRHAQRMVLELAGVQRRLDAARAELIEAARRRRAVELLRERRLEQWKIVLTKAETDALDELAVIAASRNHHDDAQLLLNSQQPAFSAQTTKATR